MIVGVTRRISSPVFVGRRAELARLEAAFDRAAVGQPSLVLVAGEAGVGKSRLLAEFAARVEAGGGRTLSGGCLDLGEGSLPYAPFVEALRSLARALPPEARAATFGTVPAELANLVPDLLPLDSPAALPLEGLTGRQARLFDAIIDVLGRLAADRAVVLALEDLHWADGSTRDLIRFLVRNIRSERLLLLATFRSDDLHRRHPLMPLLSELQRSDRVEQVDLRRFDRDEVAEQLTGILGEPPTTEHLDTLLDRSDGVPFYVEELVASDDLDRSRIPTTLRNVLELRLASLSDPTMEAVRAAAVIGGRFRHERLAAVADLDEPALLDALREAIDARIIASVENPEGPTYTFRHALLRETAYDDLLPAARVRLHARLADHLGTILEAGGTQDVSLVADFAIHAHQAHDQVRALDGSVRAVLALAESAAYAEALEHGQRALELWARVPHIERQAGIDRPELLLRASAIAANAGRPERAVALGQEAIRELDSTEDRDRIVAALADVARYAWEATEFAVASAAAERAYALIGIGETSSLSVSVMSALGLARYSEGRPEDSVRLLEKAMTAASTIGDRRRWASAAGMLAETLVGLGRPGRAARVADEATVALAEPGGESWEIYGSASSAFAIWTMGRLEESERIGRDGLEWANRYGFGERQGQYYRMTSIEALVELGRYEEAEELARPIVAGRHNTPAAIWILQATARAAVAQGRLNEARTYLERANRIHGPSQNEVWRLEVEIVLARAQQHFEVVESAIDHAIAIASVGEFGASIWQCLATGTGAAADEAIRARTRRRADEAADAAGQARRWLGLLRAIVETAEADGGAGPFWLASLATAEAEATRSEGATDAALWAEAAHRWSALPHPLHQAEARLRQAEAILGVGGGERAEAEAAVRAAYATAVAIGAAPLRAELEALAQRARIVFNDQTRLRVDGADAVAVTPTVTLTARERDVLRLVVGGQTNREIGDRLFISEKTVSVHVSNAMAKLGALSRYEAAASAERLGLL